MPNDFEKRIGNLEGRFDDYMSMFYRWLDELRADHELTKRRIEQNEREFRVYIDRTDHRMEQNETMIARIVDTQGIMIQLLDRMDQKLDDLGKRGKNGAP